MAPEHPCHLRPDRLGKTALAVELALLLGGEVVSADSMQIYRGMDIGTAKPTPRRCGGAPPHAGRGGPGGGLPVARYVRAASACVDDILSRGGCPLWPGAPDSTSTTWWPDGNLPPLRAGGGSVSRPGHGRRACLPSMRSCGGWTPAGGAAPLSDEKRILRALEVWYETGETITDHDRRTAQLPPGTAPCGSAWTSPSAPDLWVRIDARVDEMMDRGWRGRSAGCSPPVCRRAVPPCRPSAIRSLPPPFGGGALSDAVAAVKLRSRQYAKRQRTWFRRNRDMN